MIWYVATLSKVVLVEAPTYGEAKKRGAKEIRDRFFPQLKKVVVSTCRQATKDDVSLHLLNSDVKIAGVKVS